MVLEGQVDQKFHFEITKDQNSTLKTFKQFRANLVADPFRNDPKVSKANSKYRHFSQKKKAMRGSSI